MTLPQLTIYPAQLPTIVIRRLSPAVVRSSRGA